MDVSCADCGHHFPLPAVALCPQCGSRQIRRGDEPSSLIGRLRTEARKWHGLPLATLLREAANELRAGHIALAGTIRREAVRQ